MGSIVSTMESSEASLSACKEMSILSSLDESSSSSIFIPAGESDDVVTSLKLKLN